MAKVNIIYDTANKTCMVSIDGQEVPDVEWVNVSKYDGEAHLTLDLGAVKQDGMTIRTMVSAEDGTIKEKDGIPAKQFNDWLLG